MTEICGERSERERVSGGDSENEEWSEELKYHKYVVTPLFIKTAILPFPARPFAPRNFSPKSIPCG